MLVIADTSPLHYLVLIEPTAVLLSLFGRVVIPPVVAAELQRPPSQPSPARGEGAILDRCSSRLRPCGS